MRVQSLLLKNVNKVIILETLNTKKKIVVNFEKTLDLKSRTLVNSSQDKIGNLKQGSNKKNFLFLNEISNVMKTKSKPTDSKETRYNSPKGIFD
jgi:hypothetical protein